MARLKGVFQEVMELISANTSIDYVRVWNDQLASMEKGDMYTFPNLACFVEIDLPKESLGLGYVGGDITLRFHIVHVELDAMDGTMEQNLTVFGYRDELIGLLMYKELDGCSGLQFVSERPDYNHTNVYHYILEFNCSFIDDAGDRTKSQIIKQPVTNLQVNATIVTTI